MNRKTVFFITTTSALFLSACTHTPSPGERMLSVSQESQGLGTQWNKGDALIADGNKLVKKGNKLIASGKDDLSSGQDMVNEGRKKIAEGIKLRKHSEIAFSKHFPNYDMTSKATAATPIETQASGLDQKIVAE